ncbi:MAG: ABC transporter ATP-binding protein [Cellvibrionaceae bacterium]
MITLEGISKTYQLGDEPIKALDQLNLTIEKGEYIAVMGASGSGKSTLLNVIGLLDRPDAGSYQLDDALIQDCSDEQLADLRRNRIGFVFQAFHLIPRLTAFENVELPLVLAKLPVTERTQKVEKALQQMGIGRYAQHRPSELSGGQMQRVAIARAIVTEPEILLADEPTGNLDSHSGADVVDVLENLNAQGITLLVVTHDAKLGDRAARKLWMEDGKILSDKRKNSGCHSDDHREEESHQKDSSLRSE